MATSVLIRHRDSGLTRQGYVGFSWTYLFFGWLVPLFRMLTGGWALADSGERNAFAAAKLGMTPPP